MSTQTKKISHIESLERSHKELDNKIQLEMKKLIPDSLVISDLKKRKLHIKDKLNKQR